MLCRFLHTFLGRSLEAVSYNLQHAARCLGVFRRCWRLWRQLIVKDRCPAAAEGVICLHTKSLGGNCAAIWCKIIWVFLRSWKIWDSNILDYNTHALFGWNLAGLSTTLSCQVWRYETNALVLLLPFLDTWLLRIGVDFTPTRNTSGLKKMQNKKTPQFSP